MRKLIKFANKHSLVDRFLSNFAWYRKAWIANSLEIINSELRARKGVTDGKA